MEAYDRRRHRELTWLAVAFHKPEDLDRLKPQPTEPADDVFDSDPW